MYRRMNPKQLEELIKKIKDTDTIKIPKTIEKDDIFVVIDENAEDINLDRP